jgi:hypothetical protein
LCLYTLEVVDQDSGVVEGDSEFVCRGQRLPEDVD